MKKYRIIDHTADIGIIIEGKTLKGLFKNAARATFDVMAKALTKKDLKKMPPAPKKFKINLKASSLEDLLLVWLSELVSLSDCKRIIFTDFKILALKDNCLQAAAFAQSRRYFQMNLDIKAVTYHDLKITLNNNTLSASVIFDV